MLAVILWAGDSFAAAAFLEGRVVGVMDGDTIEVLVGRETHRVRLADVDAPEHDQPWGQHSKQALSARVFGKEVRVNLVGQSYDRTVGEVYADGVCVGCELVREGNAWVARRFTDDQVLYDLEAEARAARRGLWSLPEADRVPPWEWRHRADANPKTPANRDAPLNTLHSEHTFICANKRLCREMTSCAEARFYLTKCDLRRLDADRDGVPCETICH